MSHELGFGQGQRLRIDVASESILAHFSPDAERHVDPREAVKAALSDPVGFPAVQRAVVPDDRVAIALHHSIPQAHEIVAGIVNLLLETGFISPADIEIVYTGAYDERHLRSALGAEIAEKIRVERHDADNADRLSYLAAAQDGQPVYLNRTLVDADIVIPVGTMQSEEAFGYVGPNGILFPAFSNAETLARFQAPISTLDVDQRRRRRDEAAEAAWLLGTQFTLQIIPGAGDSILEVLAGDSECVAKEGQSLCDQEWSHRITNRADLVVAAIEGGPEQQTWHNVGRELFNACLVVEDQGAVVLCTRLDEQPGPSLQRLRDSESSDSVIREIRRDRSEDAVPASVIAAARDRVRIFLLSDLDAEQVEDLGLGVIAEPEEINRLSRQSESCVLLSNAHFAALRWQED